MKKFKNLFVISLVVIFASCARDMTLDSWQKEQSNKEIASISAISGGYSGNVVSDSNGETIGTMNLQLSPDSQIRQNSTTTGLSQVPSLRGTVTIYTNHGSGTVAFDQGYFDSGPKFFKSVATIPLSGGTSEQIAISGTINGDQVTGEIWDVVYPNRGGHFNLSRGGSATRVSGISAPKTESFLYIKGTKPPENITLTLDSTYLTAEESFLSIFSPISRKQVTFTIGAGDTDREVHIFFQDALYDDRSDSLRARTNFSDGGTTFTTSMECIKQVNADATGWMCSLQNSAKGLILSGFFTIPQSREL